MAIDADLEKLKEVVANIQDREAIRDCIHRESRGRDRQDSELIASCWWDEGADEHGNVITKAPDYPESANAGHKARYRMTSHHITTSVCEVEGNNAYCESYVLTGLFPIDSDVTTIGFGRYLDQLEKRNGEGRILNRRTVIEMSAQADGSWVLSKGVKGFLKGVWSKDDPSYKRPIMPGEEAVRW